MKTPVRRWPALPLLALLTVALTGCTGQGVRAKELLDEAAQATQGVSSQTFTMRLKVTAEQQSMSMLIDGGFYLKGDRAGDGVLNLKMDGVGTPFTFQYVKKGDSISFDLNGQRVSASAAGMSAGTGAELQQLSDKLTHLDLERYVKDVSVSENETLDGEAVSKVVGVLDTSAFIQDFGSQAASAQQLPAGLQGYLPSVAKAFGDTRVVLFISQATHLVKSALVDLDLKADGKTAHVELDYGLTSVDKPIDL
jgi:hypothetical protein